MNLFKAFEEEHDSIRELLIVLTVICNSIDTGRTVELCHLEKLNEFLTLFIDKYHHQKEDQLLLPAMELAGFPRYGAMLDAISLDHQMARQYLEEMRQALEAWRSGDQKALLKFVAPARKYIEITQYNLERENLLLFHLADRRLSPHQKEKLTHDIDAWNLVGPEELARQHSSLNFLKNLYINE